MKIDLAWSQMASQAYTYKTFCYLLIASNLVLSVVNYQLSTKKALIVASTDVEGTRVLDSSSGDSKRSKKEIKRFVELALRARFDTKAQKDDLEFLSNEEKRYLEKCH